MDDIYSLMVDETRSNFFQLENLVSNLDAKAFGIIAINTILFTFFALVLDKFDNSLFWVPLSLIVVSLAILIICIWPRTWDRQSNSATVNKYGTWKFEKASSQLAINYTTWEKLLYKTYKKKIIHLRSGLILTTSAFVIGVIIFIYIIVCH